MDPRRIITSAIWALVIMAISVVGNFAQVGFPSPGRHVAGFAALLALPGQWAVLLLGLGHGPEGFPRHEDLEPYLLTFLFWWGVIHGGRVLWAQLRSRE
jgi:hypothetical protein